MRKLDQKEGEMLRRRAGWKLPEEEGPGAEVSDLFWKVRFGRQHGSKANFR